jgi:hypothetical protein
MVRKKHDYRVKKFPSDQIVVVKQNLNKYLTVTIFI